MSVSMSQIILIPSTALLDLALSHVAIAIARLHATTKVCLPKIDNQLSLSKILKRGPGCFIVATCMYMASGYNL